MDILDIIVIAFAVLWVGVGLFVKKYPRLIAGYNTMSEDELKNVDIQAVGRLMCRGFLWMAAAMVVLYFPFKLLGMETVAMVAWLAPIFVGIPIVLFVVQKYDKNVRSNFKKYLPVAIVIALFVGIGAFIATDAQPTKAVVENDAVRFSGNYGVTVPFADIAVCELWDDIPRIEARTNGLGLGNILKGHFRLEGLGKCRLFIERSDKPYLYIETTGGEKIIFNSREPETTQSLFDALQR
jgi:hypothetical protein